MTPEVNATRSQWWRSRAFLLTVSVVLALGLIVTWPQALRVQRVWGFAHLVSLRAVLVLGFAGVGVLAGAVVIARRRWSVVAGVAVAALVLAAANSGILAIRGTSATSDTSTSGELTVLTWNTQGGATGPEDVAALVLSSGASIVSLPEMDESAVTRVAELVHERGGPTMFHDTVYGDSTIPTSVLIAESLGVYTHDDTVESTPGLPSGVWTPVGHDGPVIVAAHLAPPLPSSMDDWRAGLDWVAARCSEPHTILAGDLNATVDHLGPGLSCTDVASRTGSGATGTWPSTSPAWLASPIDHVLVGGDWSAQAAHVVIETRGGTDHRALVAVISTR
ncbi:endonuclease/exonuclease/phosphatase family protein [Microbacterium gorillae]|uniref:endonuclease/exonuclease/phosphatase family protein n=1 Tax=Microbacterium gorillae TaxID=1231063 RepID=UPI0006941C2A|nr:endonuclease/exonuclease/phosphatase family protein [Microbacterium gorillae]